MRLCLFQPDIPQNLGNVLRTAACLGVAVDVIEPCGFLFDDRRLKRAGMDYAPRADLARHAGWEAFRQARAAAAGRLIALTRRADLAYASFAFRPDDVLLFGQESAGLPASVLDQAEARLAIPMRPGCRSLNLAAAAALVLGEALRQTGGLPTWPPAPTLEES